MTYRSRSSSIHKILIFVFMVAFGVITAAVSYKGMRSSIDNRARASLSNTIYKQWEFNGATNEGWTGVSPIVVSTKNGSLAFVINKRNVSPAIENTSVNTMLPKGINTFTIQMSVTPAKIVPLKTNTRLASPKPTSQPRQFSARIEYQLNGKATWETALVVKGPMDGVMRSYSLLPFPMGVPLDIAKMRIVFANVFSIHDTVAIDWMRIIGPVTSTTPVPTRTPTPWPLTPTPTSTVVCKTGVSSFSVDTACADGFRYMTFSCYDGLSRREGGLTSCKSSSVWSSYAESYCNGRSNCSTTPTPTRRPSVTATPNPTRTPTPTPRPSIGPTFTPTPTPTPAPVAHFITVTSPNGGETLTTGQSYTIQWNSSHTFSDVTIYYAQSGGFSGPIATKISDTGSYIWQVNPVYGKGQYKIYINGDIDGYNYANDSSDAYFTIN